MTGVNTTTDGLVRTLADVAAIAAETGLQRARVDSTWWIHPAVRVHCWPTMAFQVAVYALDADGQNSWSGIFDWETPAAVIAATIRAAQGATP